MKFRGSLLTVLLVASVDCKALKGAHANDEHKVDPSMGMLGVMLKGMIKTTQQATAAQAGAALKPVATQVAAPVVDSVKPHLDKPIVPDSELVAKYMAVHDDGMEDSDYEDDEEEEVKSVDSAYSDHISGAIQSATAATPEEIVKAKKVIKKKVKKAPIHLATARLLPKELHAFKAQNLDGSVAAELAKVKTQLQEQNDAIAKAIARQKAVAAKMANAVAEKLVSQKNQNAQLTAKLAKEVRLEARTEKKFARQTTHWRGEKHAAIEKIQGLKMQVKQLSAVYQQSKAKTDHFKELQADASKQQQQLNEELARSKKELDVATKRHDKERGMLMKMIQAKKTADARIRELKEMAKNPTRRTIGVAHVEAVKIPVALSASASVVSSPLVKRAVGPSALSVKNKQLAQELVGLKAQLSNVKEEQKQGKKMLWQIIGVKKKADARIKALRAMLKENVAQAAAVPTTPAAVAVPVVSAPVVKTAGPAPGGAMSASDFAAAITAPVAALQHHSHAEISSAPVVRHSHSEVSTAKVLRRV